MIPILYYALALGITVLVIAITVPLAIRTGFVDRPDGVRKRHDGEVPLTGGLALVVGVLIAYFFLQWVLGGPDFPYWLLLGVLGFGLIGLADDIHSLSPLAKVLLQILVVLPLLWAFNLRVYTLGALFDQGLVELGVWALPFTLLCVLGYANAFNMMDGIDGLAGGVGVTSLVGLAVISALSGQEMQALVALTIAGACTGFLLFNFPWGRWRAKVFLGDSGSLALGLAIALLAVSLSRSTGSHPLSVWVVMWILAYPVVDTVVIIVRRLLLGRSPFSADRLHLHYLLVDLGVRRCAATLTLVSLSALYVLFGVLGMLFRIPGWIFFVVFLAIAGLHLMLTLILTARVKRFSALDGAQRGLVE
jgi:UDP-GlcNAc:undecaprenyl-phosphate GlcNAc-1-phosphate transferase